MASPPGQSPYTVTESKVSNPLAEKQWAYLAKGPNAPLNILARDASWKAQMLEGMAKNDPKAQAKFFGHAPTAEDWARLKGGTGKPLTAPTQKAAQGGLMALRGYAEGGKALTADQAAFVKKMAKKMQGKEALTDDERARLDKIEKVTGRDVSPYSDTGAKTPGDKSIKNAADAIRGEYNDPNPQNPASNSYGGGAGDTGTTGGINPVDAITTPTFGFDPTLSREDYLADPYAGVTNPFYRQAIDQMGAMQKPEEYGQASGYYNTAAQGLQSLAGYKPQDVSAERAAAQQASAERASAAQMGQIANVSAERAAAERAAAAQMAAIGDVNAQQVDLGKYNVSASQMQRPEDVTAKELQRYQMEGTTPVTTQALEAYQMEGPGSWTDEGVSSKYMSPYMQGVIDISKREAERDYTKQMNALNAKAMSAGAFGGARQAMERSEAQRNYNQQLQDLQVKGLQQAYESGRSQYGQELSLSQQAALNNLQSKLSTQSQSSQQELQAMLANQNIDYQTKLQNLQAMLGVQSQEAQQMLNASLANQQAEMVTGQTNAQLAQQAALANQGANVQGSLANQQAALQAALANQQTQFGVGQFNAAAQNQASLQNASLGTQANLANQQAALQAALANQQTQFGVGSLNANLANQVALQNASLGTQASLQNAQLGTQTSWQNAQNALNASLANQQAGLQGNAQNIAAYGAMGNMAQGLGALGNYTSAWDQQRFTNLGQMGNTWQAGMQDTAEQAHRNQFNATNPNIYLDPIFGAINRTPTAGNTSTTSNTYTA